MTSLKQVLIERDEMTPEGADELISELKDRVWNGEDPEQILYDELGLEPDYVFDIIPLN